MTVALTIAPAQVATTGRLMAIGTLAYFGEASRIGVQYFGGFVVRIIEFSRKTTWNATLGHGERVLRSMPAEPHTPIAISENGRPRKTGCRVELR